MPKFIDRTGEIKYNKYNEKMRIINCVNSKNITIEFEKSGYKKSLDYLICGGDTSKSGKVDKAKKDGIKLMTEEELMNILNGFN